MRQKDVGAPERPEGAVSSEDLPPLSWRCSSSEAYLRHRRVGFEALILQLFLPCPRFVTQVCCVSETDPSNPAGPSQPFRPCETQPTTAFGSRLRYWLYPFPQAPIIGAGIKASTLLFASYVPFSKSAMRPNALRNTREALVQKGSLP